jgi:hypothetical protein
MTGARASGGVGVAVGLGVGLGLGLGVFGHHSQPVKRDAAGCTATFSGNFAATTTMSTSCLSLTHATTTLSLAIPIAKLAAVLDISITLPALTSGIVTSQTSRSWSATASARIGNGGCVYRGGSSVAPHGDFSLRLRSLTPTHGSLALDLAVLSLPSTNCGLLDAEHVDIAF